MILLRKAKESDILAIQDIAYCTWPNTYGSYLAEDQIRYMLDKMYHTEVLLTQMKEGHTFLLALKNDVVVGFAGFSVHDRQTNQHKLHKLYVLPEMHGLGIGKLLMNEVANLTKKSGGKSLLLNVNRHNQAAEFYTAAGFSIVDTVDLDIGNGYYMNDYIMEKTL